jgi:hypothetical protein
MDSTDRNYRENQYNNNNKNTTAKIPMKIGVFPFFRPSLTLLGAAAIAVSGLTLPARATLIYDDAPSQNGDLSNDRFNPTIIGTLALGNNQIRFEIRNTEPGLPASRDLEYFSVTVPDGLIFDQLILDRYTATATGGGTATDQIAFIALQRRTDFNNPPQFTEPPQPRDANGNLVTTNPANLLGYALPGTQVAANSITRPESQGVVITPGNDLLPALGLTTGRPAQPNGSIFPPPIGFTPPLSAGEYIFWVQQTAPGITGIQLNFVISPIPEPTSVLAILAVGGLGLVSRRQRK